MRCIDYPEATRSLVVEPVLHNWCNKAVVGTIVHIKDPLLLTGGMPEPSVGMGMLTVYPQMAAAGLLSYYYI